MPVIDNFERKMRESGVEITAGTKFVSFTWNEDVDNIISHKVTGKFSVLTDGGTEPVKHVTKK